MCGDHSATPTSKTGRKTGKAKNAQREELEKSWNVFLAAGSLAILEFCSELCGFPALNEDLPSCKCCQTVMLFGRDASFAMHIANGVDGET